MHLPLILSVVLEAAASFKILGYNPIFGNGHANYIGKIADTLSEIGHEVVLLTPIVNSRLANHTSEHARVIFFEQTQFAKEYEQQHDVELSGLWTASTANAFATLKPLEKMARVMAKQCEVMLSTPGFLEKLRAERFDAAYSGENDLCGHVIFNLLGIEKYALAHSLPTIEGTFAFTGLPSFPSYVPSTLSATSDKMTLFERMRNLARHLGVVHNYYGTYAEVFDKQFRAMLLNVPPITELLSKSSFFFVNCEPLYAFPSLSVEKVVEIGGITAVQSNPLDERWSTILQRRNRTVLISFGSEVQSYQMPEAYKQSIKAVVRSFPDITFIWKYEKPEDGIADHHNNLIAVPWIPQNDMLNDGRLAAFVTHGGAGSITESVLAGVPLVVIPIYGDHFRNAQQAQRAGSALFVSKEDLATPYPLKTALGRVLGEPSFRRKAKETAQMIHHRPFSAKEKLIRHFEFMARFGPFPNLDHHSLNLSFIEFYLLDVIAVILFAEMAVVGTLFLLLRLCLSSKTVPRKRKRE